MTANQETTANAVARVKCAVVGHHWDWREHVGAGDVPYRCERCRHYDDEPKIKRAAKRRAWLRRWSPAWGSLSRRALKLRIGWEHRPAVYLSLRLHFGLDRTSELPGLNITLHVGRLNVWGGIGSGYQDEDGEGRSLVGLNVTFTTYGLRWIGCWLGHKPEAAKYAPHRLYCARCDESLDTDDCSQSSPASTPSSGLSVDVDALAAAAKESRAHQGHWVNDANGRTRSWHDHRPGCAGCAADESVAALVAVAKERQG